MRANLSALSQLDRQANYLIQSAGKYKRELPEFVPHPAQAEVLATARRWNVLSMGRRWGKTLLGINLLLAPALEGYPVAWFAPVYRSVTEVWREFAYYLGPAIKAKNNTEKRIELFTGGVIEFWSLDKSPDLVRGRKYKRIVVDEAAMLADLKTTWYLILRPLLTDYEGDGWLTSTPRGYNAFHDFYLMGQDDQYPEWQSWRFSSYTNPYLSEQELDAAKAEMPARMFEQEILAEFLETLSGGMFQRDWFGIVEKLPPKMGQRVRAWDLAATSSATADFTVGVLLVRGAGENDVFYVVDVVRGKWTPAKRDEVIRATAERDGRETTIVLEEEGGSAGKSQSMSLSRLLAGYRVKTVRPTGDKATRATPLASQVENGNVFLLRGKWNHEFLSELESFPEPEALHDDQVDAAAHAFNYMIQGDNTRPWVGVSIIGGQKET